MKNNMVITGIIVVAVGAAAFFGGMQYQNAQVTNRANGQFTQGGPQGMMQRGQGGQGRFGRNGGATMGEIVSVDSNSITVQLPDGSSKIVNLSGSTTYSKTDTASQSDLKKGEKIAVFGTANSDGSITAQNVQLNPMFRMGGPGGQRQGSPSPSVAK